MNRKLIVIISFLACGTISFLLGIQFEKLFSGLEKIGEPLYTKSRIYFPEIETSLFIKTKVWGLTGDHRVVAISTNPEEEFQHDFNNEYVIQGFEEIYYQKKQDTLMIYSWQIPATPKVFDSNIKVVFTQIDRQSAAILEKEYQNELKKIKY